MRFVSRTWNLIHGLLLGWVGTRERRNPAAVYDSAIEERLGRYRTLREAAAGVIYVRGKLAKQLETQRAELERLSAQLELAVERSDDAAALALISRRDRAAGEVDRLSGELAELSEEAEVAKRNLIAYQGEIVQLRDEKVRMLARLANARMRLQLRETLDGLSTEADVQALQAVRDHIHRLVNETRVGRELGDADLERRLDRIREAEANASARAQLDELKRRRRSLVPVVLPQASGS